MDFSYLNVTSIYSFHETALSPKEYAEGLKSFGFTSGGACDYLSMRCFADYQNIFQEYGKKFLAGMRTFLAIDSFKFDCLIYIRNYDGYKALIEKLIKPKKDCLTLEDISSNSDDLILIIRINSSASSNFFFFDDLRSDGGKVFAKIYSSFKNFYLGIEFYSDIEKEMIEEVREFAQKHSLETVAIPEVKYLNKQLATRAALLNAIKNKTEMSSTENPVFYMLGSKALATLYTEEELKNTLVIKDMCNFSIYDHQVKQIDYGEKKEALLKDLITQAIKEKNLGNEYLERAESELEVIKKMNFVDYFLLVHDYVEYAKKNDIKVGPGRGSSASSLVAYLLNITYIDPIKYDLLFERFLNIDRQSMPDIDIDFEDDRREEVINYLVQKFGSNHIKHIITYATYRSASAINAVGEVLKVTKERLKLLTSNLTIGKSIRESINNSFYLSKLYNDSYYKNILDLAMLIEGFPYNNSIHASGIIASFDDLDSDIYCEDEVVGYEFPWLEKIGYLKLDILGLANLSFIRRIENEMKKNHHSPIDYDELNLNDDKVFNLLNTGATLGIFQLESSGMKDVITRVKPTNFNDILSIIALYRPGPMDNIPLFIKNKNNNGRDFYFSSEIEKIISDTYGIIIYQEQVMLLAKYYAGFDGSEADMLRYAMSKKKSDRIKNYRERFFSGAQKLNRDKKECEKLFSWIEEFAGYGFNKAHTVSYAYITYLLLYYKAHYQQEFFKALNPNGSSAIKLELKDDLNRLGLSLKVCDIKNVYESLVIKDNTLFLGLKAIKGLKQSTIDLLTSLDFSHVTTLESVFFIEGFNKIEANDLVKLVDSGFFDPIFSNRECIRKNITSLLSLIYCEEGNSIPLIKVNDNQVLNYYLERQALGINISLGMKDLLKSEVDLDKTYVIIGPTGFNSNEFEAINDDGMIKLVIPYDNDLKPFDIVFVLGRYRKKNNTLYVEKLRRIYE